MLHQMKTINRRTFVQQLCNSLRSLSTSPACKQQHKPSPWMNIDIPQTESESPAVQNQRGREDLAAAYRGLVYYGLSEGICNHLASRVPARNGGGEVMLIVKYGVYWTEVTASSLLGINLENGRVVEGNGEPETSALEIHSAIHKHALNTDSAIKASFHTHAPHATTLACLEDPTLLMMSQNSARFFNDISYDAGYDGLATTGEEGSRIAKQLGGNSVMFMGNHGVLVTGCSSAEAFCKTYYLERAAQLQVLAMSTGKKISTVSDELASIIRTEIENDGYFLIPGHFNAIKRVMKYYYPGDYTK